jgi:hypothetical protein
VSDLLKLVLIAGLVEQNALVEIVSQKCTDSCPIDSRQQVRPDVFCANRVGLCLLIVFPLIVSVSGHRKAKSDDEGEQCQDGGHDKIKIMGLDFFEVVSLLAKKGPDPRRQQQREESENNKEEWESNRIVHMLKPRTPPLPLYSNL